MSNIKFRMAAKTNVGLVRTNNEDNFQAASDLCAEQMTWVNNEVCDLGAKGALLVVADGMGGMNAGEVASQLAIDTVREYFAPANITAEVLESRYSIEKFMNAAIVAADDRIKREGREHSESRGMGTTIVIGWIYDGKLYVSWCGDSRAYVYNPKTGLHQLSVDHSYVQRLVEQHKISRDDAFDYPESNIITRSLCDAAPMARPESLLKPYTLCDNDIVMLCTDGLSGMIRDDEIQLVMKRFEHDMDKLSDHLIAAALSAAGSDNVTLCLCQIMEGGASPDITYFDAIERRLNGESDTAEPTNANKLANTIPPTGKTHGGAWQRYRTATAIAAAVMVIGAAVTLAFVMGKRSTTGNVAAAADTTGVAHCDSTSTSPQDNQAQANTNGQESSGYDMSGLSALGSINSGHTAPSNNGNNTGTSGSSQAGGSTTATPANGGDTSSGHQDEQEYCWFVVKTDNPTWESVAKMLKNPKVTPQSLKELNKGVELKKNVKIKLFRIDRTNEE